MPSNVYLMKKHILPGLLIGALALAPSQSQAQIRNDRGTFNLPTKGDVLIETQGNLDFTGGTVITLREGFLSGLNAGLDASAVGMPAGYTATAMPMVKIRKFVSNNTVARLFFNISHVSSKTTVASTDVKNNNFGIALGLGLEKVFTPAERMNTYVGGDVLLGFARIRHQEGSTVDNHQSGFGAGLRVFTGMDYYVLPKIYLGLELGLGLSYNGYGVVKYKSGDNDAKYNGFAITPFINPQFRLGYVLGWTKKAHGNGEPSYRSNGGGDDE